MKILYLSAFDLKGGAARGAYRLHRGFINNGIDSKLVVSNKLSDDYTVIGPQNQLIQAINLIRPQFGKLILKLQKSTNKMSHSLNLLPSNLHKFINKSDADIVMLHWVGREMLSIAEIGKIKKPIVWRLADQWAFCGAEHYTLPKQTTRFINGYTPDNRLNSDNGLDIDRWVWKRKLRHWHNKQMTIVTGSNWLADYAKQSFLFRHQRVEVIPSGLDTDIFKPVDKKIARKILNLPLNKKLILFGSMSASSDKRKGFHLLRPALQSLSQIKNTDLAAIIFGSSEPKEIPDFGMPCHYLSTLHDDWSLVLAYSAADIFVLPTMQDNLPNTIIESMACKTPCVSFNVGGLSDMIEHNKNGYLAAPFNTEDLSKGIKIILEDDELRSAMSEKCRQKALEEYAIDVQVNRYLKLFETL